MSKRSKGRGLTGISEGQAAEGSRLARAAGNAVLNFGNLETQTYSYLSLLRGTVLFPPDVFVGNRAKLFAPRVDMVVKALKQSDVDAEIVSEACALWRYAKELAKHHNAIVHGPVIFNYGGGPPETIGFADMGAASDGKATSIPVEHVEALSVAVRNLVKRLYVIYEKLKQSVQ